MLSPWRSSPPSSSQRFPASGCHIRSGVRGLSLSEVHRTAPSCRRRVSGRSPRRPPSCRQVRTTAATRSRRDGESRKGPFRPPTRPQQFPTHLRAAPSDRIPALGLPARERKERSRPKPLFQQNKGRSEPDACMKGRWGGRLRGRGWPSCIRATLAAQVRKGRPVGLGRPCGRPGMFFLITLDR